MAATQTEGKITALYERLSRDDDIVGDGSSIPNQKTYLEAYAAQQGFTNCVHYMDDGYSGVNFDRPGWNRMIDEEVAAVVRRIFQLTIEGRGPYEIARILFDDKVEAPTVYLARQNRGVWKSKEEFRSLYNWTGHVVGQILANPEYMGDTVNFRSHKASYTSTTLSLQIRMTLTSLIYCIARIIRFGLRKRVI